MLLILSAALRVSSSCLDPEAAEVMRDSSLFSRGGNVSLGLHIPKGISQVRDRADCLGVHCLYDLLHLVGKRLFIVAGQAFPCFIHRYPAGQLLAEGLRHLLHPAAVDHGGAAAVHLIHLVDGQNAYIQVHHGVEEQIPVLQQDGPHRNDDEIACQENIADGEIGVFPHHEPPHHCCTAGKISWVMG